MSKRKTPLLGPYSKADAIAKIDRRKADAQFIRRIRLDLTEHLGGRPSKTQELIICRISLLAWRLNRFDERMLTGGDLTPHDQAAYLSWNNSMVRACRELGLKAAPKPRQSLDDYVASKTGKAA